MLTSPLVIIFGRANVGKSTLFNRLTEQRQALVSPIAGTTRDANQGEMEWQGVTFTLVDTGGIMDFNYSDHKKQKAKIEKSNQDNPTAKINYEVQERAYEYLKKADIILFTVDAKEGLTARDKEMSMTLKKLHVAHPQSRVILVANKTDSASVLPRVGEFYQLAMGDPVTISSTTGSGTGDLLDIITDEIKARDTTLLLQGGVGGGHKKKKYRIGDEDEKEADDAKKKEEDKNKISICILGKPNVGKSSLLNKILKEEKVIVSPLAHTTREPQDTYLNYQGQEIRLIDTAGISRSGSRQAKRPARKEIKSAAELELAGINKSLKALRRANVALLVLDINEGIMHQDVSIAENIIERGKNLVIIANKWDAVEDRDTQKYIKDIHNRMPFAHWAPIQFTSALTGEKVDKIMDIVLRISKERKKTVSEKELAEFVKAIIRIHPPTKGRGAANPRIRKIEQAGDNPPFFIVRIGSNEDLHSSYVRFIENRLRIKFGFEGTPIKIKVIKK
jgi:GTP-binding protein